MDDKDDFESNMQLWSDTFDREISNRVKHKTDPHIRISRFPHNLTAKAIANVVGNITKIMPIKTSICYLEEDEECKNPMALLKFKSNNEILMALDKLKQSSVTRQWRIETVYEPKVDNDDETSTV